MRFTKGPVVHFRIVQQYFPSHFFLTYAFCILMPKVFQVLAVKPE